jgi:hypothetical protein
VVECELHEFAANALTLVFRQDEEVREKPKPVAHPTESETDHITRVLRHPEPVLIVLQREGKELGCDGGGKTLEAMTLHEVVNALVDHLHGRSEIFVTRSTIDDRYKQPPTDIGI